MARTIAGIIPMKKKAVVTSHAKTINVFTMMPFVMESMIVEISATKKIVKVIPQGRTWEKLLGVKKYYKTIKIVCKHLFVNRS